MTLDFFSAIKGVTQYRIIQEREGSFTIQVVPDEDYANATTSLITRRFIEGLGEDVQIKIEIIDTSILRGKISRVVSKLSPS